MPSPAKLAELDDLLAEHRTPVQLLLAGILQAGLPTHGLFYAIYPDPMAAASLVRLACHLRVKHGLRGPPFAANRFHITLHHFGHYHDLRRDLVEMAGEAGANIIKPPFRVAFDRVLSFRRGSDDRPLVLLGNGRATALRNFRQDLGVALTKTGLGRKVARPFTPHVTLLYDQQCVAEQAIETVSWTVNEFALVHSLIGQTKHLVLARWPLRANPDIFDHDRAAR
jgi:2'-5' RNA ligase